MASLPPSGDEPKPESPTPAEELVPRPHPGEVIVEDTSRSTLDTEHATTRTYTSLKYEATFHSGPFPDPETLRRLAEIYPDAPKLIFENFAAQSAHRRQNERDVIANKCLLARRGQVIGGLLGGIGLTGSLIVAGMGYQWFGFAVALGSLGSLVSIFVHGREDQKNERLAKAELQERISKNEAIENLEGGDPGK